MRVTSINEHIRHPEGAVFVRAEARYAWFVISYDLKGQRVEVFYNSDGREVFKIEYRNSLWQKIKEFYADSDSTSIV